MKNRRVGQANCASKRCLSKGDQCPSSLNRQKASEGPRRTDKATRRQEYKAVPFSSAPSFPLSVSPCLRVYLLSLLIASAVGLPAIAAEEQPSKMITPAADRAIQRGLSWLASRQHDDGAFGGGAYRDNVAIVSLAGLAMISGGSTPDRGPYGPQVARCLDYLLSNTHESGFIAERGYAAHTAMYGHGFSTLFLAECCGMTQRRDIREKLSKAAKLIVNTQNEQGGWRYAPQREPVADTSVSSSQAMALRAARNAGIFVPKETIDRAIRFFKEAQNPDGGFKYMLPEGESLFPRSAASMASLYSLGIYDGPEITKGLSYVMQFKPKPGVAHAERDNTWFYYGHYYAALVMWQAGGKRWAEWYPAIRDELISRQQPDGSWVDPSVSPEFATSAALLVLQMPNNLLPIFQR